MPRPSRVATLGAVLSALVLAHCVRVPPADEMAKPPQVDELVRRVKCDLYEAVADRLNAPYGYEWLHSWTAQANLNLIVNDQTQIDPGATFTQPLTTKTLPLRVTSFARSWNLGLGAEANNTATRNETVTFTVSMNELMDQFGKGQHNCDFPNYIDLRSELGLKEWVAAALAPVEDGDLKIGYHKSPKTGTGGSTATAAAKTAQTSMAAVMSRSPPAKGPSPGLNCDDVSKLPRDPGPPSGARLNADLDIVSCELSHVADKTEFDFSKLDAQQVRFVAQTIEDIHRVLEDLPFVKSAASRKLATDLEKAALELAVFVDPPIDTISHQVQFIIVLNASTSPSWTLVHFKGPSPSGSLFSVTSTKTHTLNIAIGPPSSPDTTGALQALQIGTAVGNALNTGTSPAP